MVFHSLNSRWKDPHIYGGGCAAWVTEAIGTCTELFIHFLCADNKFRKNTGDGLKIRLETVEQCLHTSGDLLGIVDIIDPDAVAPEES